MVALLSGAPASVTRDTPNRALAEQLPAWRMSTTNTLHSPLEELLFFHTLQTFGAEPSAFSKISAALNDNSFVRTDPGYDADRLSPGNLQQLYLRLLKEEVRSSLRDAEAPETEGESNKRKRKPTPPLQSLEEALQHEHLLPQLVQGLYARYQEHAVGEIREEEARYDQLQKDIAEIEHGNWDAQLEEGKTRSPNGNSSSHVVDVKIASANPVPSSDARRHSSVQSPFDEVPARASPHARPLSTVSQKRSPSTGLGDTGTANQLTPAQAVTSSAPDAFQLKSQPRLGIQDAGPPGPEVASSQPERPPGSPKILPLSVPGNFATPFRQPDRLPELHGQQPRRTATTPTSAAGQQPSVLQAPQSIPQAGAYGQRPPPYGQPQQYPSYPPYIPQQMAQPQAANQSPHIQAYSVPPYQSHPLGSNASQPTYQGQASPMAGFGAQHPGFMVYPSPQARPSYSPYQQTPVQTPASNANRRPGMTPINTSVSSTRWKSVPNRPTKDAPKSPVAPPRSPFLPSSPEPSPTDDDAKSPPSSRKRHSTRESSNPPVRARGRPGRWASHIARGRRGRASDAQHAPRGTSTPDASAASPAKESTPDMGPARRGRGEPSTPAGGTEDTSAISTPGSTVRPARRRDTVRPSQDLGRKRKRASTLEGRSPEGGSMVPLLPNRPGYVLASRNFPRVVSPLMHEINSHKLASMFAKPITERDAPGYHAIIYQPQDLKSIRSAISAGTRAVAAAEKETAGEDGGSPAMVGTPTTASTGKGGNVWVEKTPELVPPRGIVNATQLEKEVCRMFANAVMFNLDPQRGLGEALTRGSNDSDDEEEDAEKGYEVDDGGAFVRDAREMFEGVEQSVRQWRSVERNAGEGVRPRGGGMDESEGDDGAE